MRHKDRAAGIALAAIAASLFTAMPLTSTAHSDGEDAHPHGVNGKCVGGNACKGHSACRTANGQCAGQNACKSQGFSITTAEDCEEKGGTFEAV